MVSEPNRVLIESDNCQGVCNHQLGHGLCLKGKAHKDFTQETKPMLQSIFAQDRLPSLLKVSTMSITFRISRAAVDLQHLANEMELDIRGVCTTDFRGELRTLRTPKRRRRKKPNFYNSMTLEVSVGEGERVMHFKVFRNGSIQGAGCQSVQHGNYAINVLKKSLEAVMQCELELSDLKINLINVNFKMGHSINRDVLHRLLLSEGQVSSYEKCKHAGVGLKFLPKGKERPISVFIFESGSVVITGSKNEQHILEGYEYVCDFVRRHRQEVNRVSSSDLLERTISHPQYAQMLVTPLLTRDCMAIP